MEVRKILIEATELKKLLQSPHSSEPLVSRGRDLLLPWFSPAPSFWLLSSSFSCMFYTVEGTADSSSQTHSYSSVTKNE